MVGAVKHMERSHRSHANNNSEFRKFSMRAIRTSEQKGTRKSVVKPIGERIKNAFSRKHQDRQEES